MDENERYQRARRRVLAMKGFYIHLAVYILVNIGLFFINILTSPNALWFCWPLLGWAIGLAAHAVSVFGVGSKDWEEREIKKIMENDQ